MIKIRSSLNEHYHLDFKKKKKTLSNYFFSSSSSSACSSSSIISSICSSNDASNKSQMKENVINKSKNKCIYNLSSEYILFQGVWRVLRQDKAQNGSFRFLCHVCLLNPDWLFT